MAPRSTYQGRSLAWLRTLLGLPPVYPSARAASKNSGVLETTTPPLGAVVWYESMHGNCALSLGEGQVLALDRAGDTKITSRMDPELGKYLGWTPTIGTPQEES